MKQAAVPAPPAPPIQPPATPIQPHISPIDDDTEENPFCTPTIHPPDRHVTFNLTPAVAPPPISNSELGDSPWLHSPSDALPPAPPPAPAAPNPNPQTPAREDFTWVFETGTGTPEQAVKLAHLASLHHHLFTEHMAATHLDQAHIALIGLNH